MAIFSRRKNPKTKNPGGRTMRAAQMKQQGFRLRKSDKQRHKKVSKPTKNEDWLKKQKDSINKIFKV